MAGRPTTYTNEIGNSICAIIASSSKSMKTICEELNISIGTVLEWLSSNKEFSELYAKAKEQQADYLAEEILDIADNGRNDFMVTKFGVQENKEVTNRSRLRVDTRKWIASKLKPKKYADRIDHTNAGEKFEATQVLALPTEALKQLEQIITNAATANNKTDATSDSL